MTHANARTDAKKPRHQARPNGKLRAQKHGASLRGLIEGFGRDRRGVVAAMLGLMFPVMLGFIGLGLEIGLWYEDKRDIQTAADAAAIAGAYELYDGGTATSVQTIVENEVTRNNSEISTANIDANTPPLSGDYTADDTAVEVEISGSTNLLFTEFFLDGDITISARAVAVSFASGDEACVLALDASAQRAINVSGTADVSMDGCYVASNSTESNAINVAGGASLDVDCGSTAGGVNGTVTTSECDSVEEGANNISDPFSGYEVPTFSGCTTTATDKNDPNYALAFDAPSQGGTAVLCDGITINAGETVDFAPGVYIINEGSLKINGGATVTGDDVTFIFTGSGMVDWADASVNGGATIDLSAPTDSSNDWQGILFYQDPDAATNPANDFTFNGDSSTELTGAIYIPNNSVTFSGGNELDDNGCLLIVAQTVTFNGNADFENECDGIMPTAIYTSYTVRLVE